MKKTLFTYFLILSAFALKAQTVDTTKQIFTAVEMDPSFAGGLGKFYMYLQANIIYPADSFNKNIQGKVFVTFVVEKDGSLTDVKVLRSVSPDIDTEAIRVVSNSPKWHPRIQNGRPVRVQYSLAINFKFPPKQLVSNTQQIDTLFSKKQIDSIRSKQIFTAVEYEPEFPGGMEKFHNYLGQNLQYPDQARNKNIRGQVFISFVVNRDGSLTDVHISRGLSTEIDAEAIRLIKNSPMWKSGMQNGRHVRVAYTLPIPFPFPRDESSAKAQRSDADSLTFTPVEKEPEFLGGLEKFFKFLTNNLHYPDQARENNVQGKVIVSFVVERDGTLTDVKVSRGLGSGCDEEAVRVLRASPKWKPGMQNGRPVRVAYTMPISFPINE